MRIVALADIHSDFAANSAWLEALSSEDHQRDVLILAGDVSHDLDVLLRVLEGLTRRFARVFFTPGNHDLWLTPGDSRSGEASSDSWHKLQRLLRECRRLGVGVKPERLGRGDDAVWIVPLLGWYAKAVDDHSLYRPLAGEDPRAMAWWSDSHRIHWPGDMCPAQGLLALNPPLPDDGAPVITFSHFLPRGELLTQGWPPAPRATGRGTRPRFNFSLVAGTTLLDAALRRRRALLHVYGHQHRDRRRLLDGVLYVSHCLGYPREQARGWTNRALEEGPLPVWGLNPSRPLVSPWDGDGSPWPVMGAVVP
ncbi:MAG: metallophosphoesterase [Candidatus Competibacterales bacterium]